MTAQEIFVQRTGTEVDKACFYTKLAESAVREYLCYEEGDDISKFSTTTADVAVLYYQRDTQVQTLGSSAAVKSESFSEGAVSASKTYLTAGDLYASYDAQAAQLLNRIRRYRRAHVVTRNKDADAG